MTDNEKAAVRELIEGAATVLSGPGTEAERVARLKRAAEALASEQASDATIDAALKDTGGITHE